MKYCTKCKKVYANDKTEVCPKCRRELISDPNSFSPVDLVTANGFELERIGAALKDEGIPFTTREVKRDMGISIMNAAPPENCIVTVPLGHYKQASELLIGIGAMDEAEELKDEDIEKLSEEENSKEKEEPLTKSTFNKVVLIVMFVILVGITIALADIIGRFINPSFYQ